MEILAAQLIELGVSQGPEAPPRPNRQHKGPAVSSTSNSVQPASGNDQNNKQMPQSSSILDQVSDWSDTIVVTTIDISAAKLTMSASALFLSLLRRPFSFLSTLYRAKYTLTSPCF